MLTPILNPRTIDARFFDWGPNLFLYVVSVETQDFVFVETQDFVSLHWEWTP